MKEATLSLISVQFPDGQRDVEAADLARNGLGQLPAVLRVPRAVPGFRLTREERGWRAVAA